MLYSFLIKTFKRIWYNIANISCLWEKNTAKDMLSASIVVYGGAEQAKITVASVLENTKKYPLTLYVIDNASPDDTVQNYVKFRI